jgi:hypothetical protein
LLSQENQEPERDQVAFSNRTFPEFFLETLAQEDLGDLTFRKYARFPCNLTDKGSVKPLPRDGLDELTP